MSDNFKISIGWIIGICIGIIIIQVLFCIGSSLSLGEGRYTGVLVETRKHGLLFKTNGAHFKTGENSSVFEDFCVTDKKIMERLNMLEPEAKIEVYYKKLLSTPSWRCDSNDSSDIIIDFKVIEDKK